VDRTAEEEDKHHRQLTAAAFRDYQAGILPTGPGARELIGVFDHVDTQLVEQQPGHPTVVANDRHIELLLAKRAATLHAVALMLVTRPRRGGHDDDRWSRPAAPCPCHRPHA
jgi:hypothetical protein